MGLKIGCLHLRLGKERQTGPRDFFRLKKSVRRCDKGKGRFHSFVRLVREAESAHAQALDRLLVDVGKMLNFPRGLQGKLQQEYLEGCVPHGKKGYLD